MPTSPDSIQKFLDRHGPPPPRVKTWSKEKCLDFIYKITKTEPTFKTEPYLNQIQGLAYSVWAKQVLLYFEPRTRKTKIALDWISLLYKVNWISDKTLVVAHSPIGVDEWDLQTPLHSFLSYKCIRSCSSSQEDFCDALESDSKVIVITWSTLNQIFTTLEHKAQGNSRQRVCDINAIVEASKFFDCVVIDEIHMAMHTNSLRYAIISNLVLNCQWRMGLSGTPIGRNPFGFWSQAMLIDNGVTLSNNYYFFENAFGVAEYNHFSPRKKSYSFDHKKMLILLKKLDHMLLTCKLSEIHDVNILSSVVELHMTGRQLDAYKKEVKEFIDQQKQASNKLKLGNIFVRLRQISSGFLPVIDDEGEKSIVYFLDCPKFLWLEDFLDQVPDDLSFVLFYEFTETGKRLCELLERKKITHGWLYGGTNDRVEVRDNFISKKSQCLVANWKAGGTGIDLSVADYMCIVESPVGVIGRKQMESRPLARGDKPVAIDDLVCSPIEKKILGYVQEGRSFLDVVMDRPDLLKEVRI